MMETIYKEEFELKKIPYADKTLGIPITLYAKGVAEFQSDGDSMCIAEVKDVLPDFMMSVIGQLEQEGCGYDDIHRQDIMPAVRELLEKTDASDPSLGKKLPWQQLRKIYFTEVHPSDADYPGIIEARKEKKAEKENKAQERTAKLWICPKCGNQEDGNFCTLCGTPKEKPGGGALTKCPSCGLDLGGRPGIWFCSACGAPLYWEAGPQQTGTGRQSEREIIRGKCNWIITPVLIQNGSAVLTDKRFQYKKNSVLSNPLLVTAAVKAKESGTDFELPVTDIVKVSQGRQGLVRTIVLHTAWKQYTCTFLGNTDAFWNAFTMVLGIPH